MLYSDQLNMSEWVNRNLSFPASISLSLKFSLIALMGIPWAGLCPCPCSFLGNTGLLFDFPSGLQLWISWWPIIHVLAICDSSYLLQDHPRSAGCCHQQLVGNPNNRRALCKLKGLWKWLKTTMQSGWLMCLGFYTSSNDLQWNIANCYG